MIHRPLFSRKTPSFPEKLNDIGLQNQTPMIRPVVFEKQHHKLVYDSLYGHNQPIGDRDMLLSVPPAIKKTHGNYISDKPSKYLDKLPPFYVLSGPTDTTLLFESRFESGNLARAT
jgi:hypothetical protein